MFTVVYEDERLPLQMIKEGKMARCLVKVSAYVRRNSKLGGTEVVVFSHFIWWNGK